MEKKVYPACEISYSQLAGFYEFITTNYALNNPNINLKLVCNYLKRALEKNMNESFRNYFAGYYIQGIYGQGGNGLVLKLCKGENDCIALKLIKVPSTKEEYQSILDEVFIQEQFAKYEIAPEIVDEKNIGHTEVIIHDNFNVNSNRFHKVKLSLLKMQPITTTLFDLIVEKKVNSSDLTHLLIDIIELFKIKTFDVKYIHGDLHTRNMATMNDNKKGNKLVFIDFGYSFASQSSFEHFVDFISLIGDFMFIQETSDDEVGQLCDQVIDLLIISSNYLYGTQFVRQNFKSIRGTQYAYFITKTVGITHVAPLNDGGIFKTNEKGDMVKSYTEKELLKYWKYLGTSVKKFDDLLLVLNQVGSEFINDLVIFNVV